MCAYSSTHYYDYTCSQFEYFITPLQEQESQSKDPIAGVNADQLMQIDLCNSCKRRPDRQKQAEANPRLITGFPFEDRGDGGESVEL